MADILSELQAALPAASSPRQDSTNAQLADLDAVLIAHGHPDAPDRVKAGVANWLGMYDAADILKLRATKAEGSIPVPAGACTA